MKVLGAIIGAFVGLVLMYAVSSAVYDPPYDSYDIATPVLLFLAHGVAVVIGWITGYEVADRLDRKPPGAGAQGGNQPGGAPPLPAARAESQSPDDRWRAVRRMVLTGGGITLLIPVLIVFGLQPFLSLHKSLDRATPESPLSRAEWAAQLSERYNRDPRALEGAARRLAKLVKDCLGDERLVAADAIDQVKRCPDMPARWNALTPDSLAALGAYRIEDAGMRWTIDRDRKPPRVVVVPDALLAIERAVPVYEVAFGIIVRRANADAPSYAVDSSVARVAHAFNCFDASAAALRQSGTWNGDHFALPDLIVQYEPAGGCPRLRFVDDRHRFSQTWNFEPGTFRFRAYHDPAVVRQVEDKGPPATTFLLDATGDGDMRFMRDDRGSWSMRRGRQPDRADPAPRRCQIDVALPCD